MNHPLQLRTVRAKLTALVAFTVVMSAAALSILWWLLERQLVATTTERVADAKAALRHEMDDDLEGLSLTARIIAASWSSESAVDAHSVEVSEMLIGSFEDQHVRVLRSDSTEIATFSHAAHSHGRLGHSEGVRAVGRIATGIDALGCAGERGMALRAVSPFPGGVVEACSPIVEERLVEEAERLELELAIPDPHRDSGLIARTARFPTGARAAAHSAPALANIGGRTWCVAPIEVHAVQGSGSMTFLAASDVTDALSSLRRTFYAGLGALVLTSLVALIFGVRLASTMSAALRRVSRAHQRIAEHEYVHVEGIKTGDELEDLAAGFNAMVDGLKERDDLRTTFGKYMTPEIVDHLMAGKVELGGTSLVVTILFTDIRDFTSISERMDAHELVALLNEYFTEMVGVVIDEGGVVDKYIGDAIMAVFGAPVSRPDDALRAVRAAGRMRERLAVLNAELAARGIAPIRTGIGIHTGSVVAGNIGSEQRMEYTVIGDNVNLASRLEGRTKDLDVDVVISDETYQLVKDACVARRIDEIRVKGRERPVVVHELVSVKPSD